MAITGKARVNRRRFVANNYFPQKGAQISLTVKIKARSSEAGKLVLAMHHARPAILHRQNFGQYFDLDQVRKRMVHIEKFSFGIGDRFGCQAAPQLLAFKRMAAEGIDVVPVWNKSNREHLFVGSEPSSVRQAAEIAVKDLAWSKSWYVDADHIRLDTVDRFVDCSNFFTIDVADSIGGTIDEIEIRQFVNRHSELKQPIPLAGRSSSISIEGHALEQMVRKYLPACKKAGAVYRHIAEQKGEDTFVAEVSMDETEAPQTPAELLVILAALADEKIQLQTIAPKFTGRFNKGVDYVGDLAQFGREFRDDIAVLETATEFYGLPENLKLSVHSGSDKFSLYPIIREALRETGAGVHVKTAGTTWLEELIGLSEAGGAGLELAREIYAYAFEHVDELCAPYSSVVDINPRRLPTPAELSRLSGSEFASVVRHVQHNPRFNPDVRQLLHVSFKVAARAGERYLKMLADNRAIVGEQVTINLYERHLRPLFIGN